MPFQGTKISKIIFSPLPPGGDGGGRAYAELTSINQIIKRLIIMDKVLIKDLVVRGIIGINPDERTNLQDILINITLFTHIENAEKSDDIGDCVNYRTVAKKVFAHTENAKRFTVEALAGDIAHLCLEEKGVSGVRVCVEKPGAVRFARSVGIEIERGQIE